MPPSDAPDLPSSFGRYRVEGIAGRGGMGTVYRAVDEVLERPVALKVLSPQYAGDAAMRARLARESVHAAALQHPNAVTVYDAGEADGSLFLVMRWVDGEDLENVLARQGRLDAAPAVAILEQVAGALDAAHAAGLVHRDVKPGNVLLDREGGAFLTDFGVTKDTTAAAGVTATGEVLGTVDYVAPEQAEGAPLDGRADVYALGALAFRMLAGRVPFEREGSVARLIARLSEPAPSLADLRPDLPAGLGAAVQRALARDPDDRFASAGEFAAAARVAVGPDEDAAGVAAPVMVAPAFAAAGAEAPPTERHAAVAPAARGSRRLLRGAALVATLAAGIVAASLLAFAGGGDAPRADAAGRSAAGSGSHAAKAKGVGAAAAAATPVTPSAGGRKHAAKHKHKRKHRHAHGGDNTSGSFGTDGSPAPAGAPAGDTGTPAPSAGAQPDTATQPGTSTQTGTTTTQQGTSTTQQGTSTTTTGQSTTTTDQGTSTTDTTSTTTTG